MTHAHGTLGLATLALGLLAHEACAQRTRPPLPTKIGSTIRDLQFEHAYGKIKKPERISMAELRGRVVVLEYWATW